MPSYDPTIPLVEALERVFADLDLRPVRARLEAARGPDGAVLPERVRLACVLLSAGELRSLEHYLRQAALDTRDVLYWAFHYGDEAPAHMRSFLAR